MYDRTMTTAVGFLRRARLLLVSYSLTALPIPQRLTFLQRPFSSSSSEEDSFTVSHLVGSYGFSQKEALSAAKYFRFETPEKPKSVFSFFISHGFSESQTSKILRSVPQLLLCDPQKSLLPKLQFFYSKGASKADVAKIVLSCPNIMLRSLKNQIIPSFNFLTDFFQSEEMAMTSVKRFSRLLAVNLHGYVEPNIKALEEWGVPKSNVTVFLRNQPASFILKPSYFREILEEVRKLGFDPKKMSFPIAVQSMRAMSKSTWEKKTDVYKRWGWSEEEIRSAFLKLPGCMMHSEAKITAVMDFFVNKVGLESSSIARRPVLVSLSLKKRLAPRYAVAQVLRSKGLIKKDIKPKDLFESTEEMFLDKFVNCYEEEAPMLMKLYQEQINLSESKDDCPQP